MFDHQPPAAADKPDCQHCAAARAAAAQTHPGQRVALTGAVDASCLGCIAREIATSPAAWRALRGITATDLRNAILRHWPGSAYEAGRRAVWDWCQTLRIGASRRA